MDDAPRDWQILARRLAQSLAARGIHEQRVLDAVARTPRHLFLDAEREHEAYFDIALGIECGQTISQPYIVALMTEAARLTGSESVLEIGTGSGYQAAILAQLARHVVTVERWGALSQQAHQRLDQLGLRNLEFVVGDGTLGWPPLAPYDSILVTAAAPDVPVALWTQLKDAGRLVIPVGSESQQSLLLVTRDNGQRRVQKLCDCRFVKLIGAEGWPESILEDS